MSHHLSSRSLYAALLTAATMALASTVVNAAPTHVSVSNHALSAPAPKEEPMTGSTSEQHRQVIYLAGGCFWGVEAYFERIPGVIDAVSGYANGRWDHPSYEDLIYRKSGHAETVMVTFDPTKISLIDILRYYFRIIDPTSLNKQGNDRGVQYRTGIYFTSPEEEKIAKAVIEQEQKKYRRPIQVEVLPLQRFDPAEDYHQDYLKKNPNGYCHIDLNKAFVPLKENQ